MKRLLILAALVWSACDGRLRVPDPQNELPFGVIDVPAPGASVKRNTFVSGWVLDDSGIRGVQIYVDGKYVIDARLGLDRPDVSKAHPRYGGGSNAHGWGVEVDLGDRTGSHVILAQAIDDTGATRDLGAVSITIAAP